MSGPVAKVGMWASYARASVEPLTCAGCLQVQDHASLFRALMVCPECGHHFPLSARERLAFLADDATFAEWDEGVTSVDPLGFVDRVPYPVRLQEAQAKSKERDAIVTGRAAVRGRAIGIGVFEFRFMGGSMGSAVGEKVLRLFARAEERRLPVVMVSASGGARMQEGTLSLMQMAKVTVAVERFRRTRLPYISVLTHPTTGGVAASLAALGDVIFAEPGAQIGFAGPRVIEQTIRAPLPSGFQRAERLVERGLIDGVVHRSALRDRLHALLRALCPASASR